MKAIRIKMGQEPIARDPYAEAMWGRYHHQVHSDRRKRKPRHKVRYEEEW